MNIKGKGKFDYKLLDSHFSLGKKEDWGKGNSNEHWKFTLLASGIKDIFLGS